MTHLCNHNSHGRLPGVFRKTPNRRLKIPELTGSRFRDYKQVKIRARFLCSNKITHGIDIDPNTRHRGHLNRGLYPE